MTTDNIETLLTYQDPARDLTAKVDRERILEEILDGRRSSAADARTRRPRARTARLAAVGIAATTILAVPLFGNGQQAYAGWTAYPAGLSLAEDSLVTRQCQRWADLSGTQAPMTPVLSERRGENALTLLSGLDGKLFTCTQHLVPGEAKGGSSETTLAEEPSPDGLVSARGWAFSNDMGDPVVRVVVGRVGENVEDVTVHTREQGDVVATVRKGYFAAWWPGEPLEPASLHPMEFSFSVRLIDGSTRHTNGPAGR